MCPWPSGCYRVIFWKVHTPTYEAWPFHEVSTVLNLPCLRVLHKLRFQKSLHDTTASVPSAGPALLHLSFMLPWEVVNFRNG